MFTLFAVCPMGTYSTDCNRLCKCANNDICKYTDGFCPNGCPSGFKGNGCMEGTPLSCYS